MHARARWQRTVLLGGLIDVDHDRDVQALAVHPPARGVILCVCVTLSNRTRTQRTTRTRTQHAPGEARSPRRRGT